MRRGIWYGRRWSRTGAVTLLALPLLLAACGGGAKATDTPAPTKAAATVAAGTTAPAPTTAPTTSAASASVATAPPATTAGTTVTGTAAASSPSASGAAVSRTAAAATAPVVAARGTAPTKRGGGGTLKVLSWQAPTLLNVHLSQGGNNSEAARVVEEPLAVISGSAAAPDVPILAADIPSAANGGLAADGKRVTWKLRDGLKWSDGSPVTSADFVATWQYAIKPENSTSTVADYSAIATVDTPDATTIVINFKQPTATWYLSGITTLLQKAQIAACTDPKNCPINTNPIGTGPFKVKSFTPGDSVQYVINDNYREPNAPYFDAVDWKGGGDAATAAKAVQTGQIDWAWNLQVAPDVLKQVTDSGKMLDVTFGFGVEKMQINFSDPNKDVGGEKSSATAPHPFLSDPKVREALSYLVDRDSITTNLYGAAGKPTCNIIPSVPPQTNSKNTTCGFDVAKANQLLDDAGWKKGSDGIRAKNGVPMKIVFTSTVNPIREKTEQVIKQAFQQAGIAMDIKNVDAGVFFGAPTNADAGARFERDLQMWTLGPLLPDAQVFFEGFTTAAIAQKANNWSGDNYDRFSDPKYDALVEQLKKELDPEKRAQLQIQCNDYLINNHVEIPIVDRASVNGHRTDLINTNPTPWDWSVWNIAYWQIKK
ncbi:MAG: peptide ABC transporter substrate-binding protein [Chloroflexota bacterium]|nr:peptide ABC transporter substrate-binding protein [Chloroflexota bacterium]